jgi:hypothetical protein
MLQFRAIRQGLQRTLPTVWLLVMRSLRKWDVEDHLMKMLSNADGNLSLVNLSRTS